MKLSQPASITALVSLAAAIWSALAVVPSAAAADMSKKGVSVGVSIGVPVGHVRGPSHFHHRHYHPYAPYRRVYWGPPVIGTFVAALPIGYATVWLGGIPYYRYNDVYYMDDVDGGYRVVRRPSGASAPAAAPTPVYDSAAVSGPAPEILMLIPRNGQTETQTTFDRIECERAASQTTGYNPAQGGGDAAKRSQYQSGLRTCLEARGYSLK